MSFVNEDVEKTKLLLEEIHKEREEIFGGLDEFEVRRYKGLLWSFSKLLYLQFGKDNIRDYRNEAASLLSYPKIGRDYINDKEKIRSLEIFISRISDYLFCITREIWNKQLREYE